MKIVPGSAAPVVSSEHSTGRVQASRWLAELEQAWLQREALEPGSGGAGPKSAEQPEPPTTRSNAAARPADPSPWPRDQGHGDAATATAPVRNAETVRPLADAPSSASDGVLQSGDASPVAIEGDTRPASLSFESRTDVGAPARSATTADALTVIGHDVKSTPRMTDGESVPHANGPDPDQPIEASASAPAESKPLEATSVHAVGNGTQAQVAVRDASLSARSAAQVAGALATEMMRAGYSTVRTYVNGVARQHGASAPQPDASPTPSTRPPLQER